MKPHSVLILLAVLLIGFLLGRASSTIGLFERNPDDATQGGPFRTRAAERGSAAAPDTPLTRLRKEIRSAPSDQCGRLLRKALETADPFERNALVNELMARMDANNFIEMSEAPARISLETGRDNYGSWRLAHERAGQVAGPLAMARWAEQNALKGPRAEYTMWGWATQDPDAARKWLDEQADLPESVRKQLLSTIISGAALSDPERAIALLGSLPEADRVGLAEKFVGALVQQQGKDRAIEWLASMSAAELESDYGLSLTRSVFDKVMWAGANQSNASVMVADMERLASVVSLDKAWIDRSMGQIRGRKTIGGIELLDQIARSPALSRIPLGESTCSNAVDDALKRDPAAVARWLAANPDSPIHSAVSSMVEKGN